MENVNLKVYIFRPTGHGQTTFGVMAESESQAIEKIEQIIVKYYHGFNSYSVQGWGTDYYELEVYEPGQVFENDND